MATWLPVQLLINSLITASHVALLGCGFFLILSVTRFFNFAHGAIYLLAPYLALALTKYCAVPLALACILGIIMATAVGVLLDQSVFRPLSRSKASSLVLLLASLGLYVVLENLVSLSMGSGTQILWQRPVFEGYAIGMARITAIQIVSIIGALGVVISLLLLLRLTRTGLWIRAVADDPELAECSGIHFNYVRSMAFAVGTGLAAVSGILAGLDVPLTPAMGLHPLMLCFVAVVIGEPFGLVGVAVASFVLGLARSYGAWFVGTEWQDATVFVLFIVALLIGKVRLFSNAAKKVTV